MILPTDKAVELARMLGEASYASTTFAQKATDARSIACGLDWRATTIVVIRIANSDCLDPAHMKQLAEGFAVAGICDRRRGDDGTDAIHVI